MISGLSPNACPCPPKVTWTPLAASTDTDLWEQARTTPFNHILSSIPRFYRAATPSGIPEDRTPRLFDAWYVTEYSTQETQEDNEIQTYTFKEHQLLFPMWYTIRLDKLNKHIHGLLQSLTGHALYETFQPKQLTICLCSYLMLLREQFTYELYLALSQKQMSKDWRSKWLNPWLHRERWACQHTREGRKELGEIFGPSILHTDATKLCEHHGYPFCDTFIHPSFLFLQFGVCLRRTTHKNGSVQKMVI